MSSFFKIGGHRECFLQIRPIYTQVTCWNTSPFGKMALNRARSHGNNVAVIARIQSDLMDLLIALTFICVIEARGQTQFLFLKHSGCRPN